jgi:hypothetical protein
MWTTSGLTSSERQELAALRREVDAIKRMKVTGGLQLQRDATGAMLLVGGASVEPAGHWAVLGENGGFNGLFFAHEEATVTASGPAIMPGGITGTATEGYAASIQNPDVVLPANFAVGVVVYLTPNKTVPGTWIFGPIQRCESEGCP